MPAPRQVPCNGQEFPFSLSQSVPLRFMVADLPDRHMAWLSSL